MEHTNTRIQLFVKFQDHIKVVCVNQHDTIECIKKLLNEPSITLYHKEKLQDDQIIEHYGIRHNDTLHANIAHLGGVPVVAGDVSASVLGTGTTQVITSSIQNAASLTQKVQDDVKNFVQRIIEHVTKVIQFTKSMITVAKFFPIITLVLMALSFLGRPMEFLLLTFGLIFVTMIYIAYSILNILIVIPMFVWFVIMDIIPLIIYLIVYGSLFVLITLICLILTIINTIMWGSLKDIVLCQNMPTDWYKTPNFHLGNKWDRGVFCKRPCYSRYSPDSTGTMCQRIPKGYPPFCPQAEIMRIYTNKKADRKYRYDDFRENSNVKYLSKKPEEREAMLRDYYLRKREFKEVCKSKMEPYDTLTLNICASADSLLQNGHLTSKKEVQRLQQVCSQAFCTAERNYPFCNKISALNNEDDNAELKKVIKITIALVVFCIIFLFTMENLYKTK
jgi:hypothetical protein